MRILIVLWLASGELSFVPGFGTLDACRKAVTEITTIYARETRRPVHVEHDGDAFRFEGVLVGVCAAAGEPWTPAR